MDLSILEFASLVLSLLFGRCDFILIFGMYGLSFHVSHIDDAG